MICKSNPTQGMGLEICGQYIDVVLRHFDRESRDQIRAFFDPLRHLELYDYDVM